MLEGDPVEAAPRPQLDSEHIACGPRVGVAGPEGSTEYPWRFWIVGDPTVSAYRAAVTRAQ
jgi:DNA-3-methyladenine glycosylase